MTDTPESQDSFTSEDLLRALEQSLPGFSRRPGQLKMIDMVATGLEHLDESWTQLPESNELVHKRDDKGRIEMPAAVVEGGTGTGKTLGYLLAALPIAKANNKKLVISTGTVALQEQIFSKDLPMLAEHAGVPIAFTLVKGRGRYACNLKLDHVDPKEHDEKTLGTINEMRSALASGQWRGDTDKWKDKLTASEAAAVKQDAGSCLKKKCPKISECGYYQARADIGQTDVIVSNHALTLADANMAGGDLLGSHPNNNIYIFDEAHQVEQYARNAFATTLKLSKLLDFLEEGDDSAKSLGKGLPMQMGALVKAIHDAAEDGAQLYERLVAFASSGSRYQDSFTFPIDGVPADIAAAAGRLSQHLEPILKVADRALDQGKKEAISDTSPRIVKRISELAKIQMLLQESMETVASFAQGKSASARWLTVERKGREITDVTLDSAPLEIGGYMGNALWQRAAGAVLTSATIRSLGSFDQFSKCIGVNNISAAVFGEVPSPFDYPNQGRLVLPPMRNAPKPRCVNYETEVAEAISYYVWGDGSLAPLYDGAMGTLVLFTSKDLLTKTLERVPDDKKSMVRVQNSYQGGNEALLADHKATVEAGYHGVIFGLSSFAEGLDLPGAACAHVIIPKLPFPSPGDPIVDSLSQLAEKRGKFAFSEIMLPHASTALNQMAGRLIRTVNDVGQITVLDNRLTNAKYGQRLVNSLPPYCVIRGYGGSPAQAANAVKEAVVQRLPTSPALSPTSRQQPRPALPAAMPAAPAPAKVERVDIRQAALGAKMSAPRVVDTTQLKDQSSVWTFNRRLSLSGDLGDLSGKPDDETSNANPDTPSDPPLEESIADAERPPVSSRQQDAGAPQSSGFVSPFAPRP